MQVKPTSWPVECDIETLPEVFLELHGSQWPPARGDVPQGTAEVGAWSVSRQLTGSALPGQVRAASGHSIATGSASFAQPDGAPLSPWGRGSLNLGPGGKCTLYASHAGPGIALGLRLGSFVVAPVSGANTSNAVQLDLDEDSVRLQRPFTLNWAYDPANVTFDAAWVLERIAADAGYTTTDIEPTGSLLAGVFGVAGKSVWAVAQEIAEATMGAVWITEAGVFTYRNRNALRGLGGYVETIEALDSLEALAWSCDPADMADRVEVAYTPAEEVRSMNTSTLWEATEVVKVSGGQAVRLTADITGTTDRFSAFIPLWEPSDPTATVFPPERMSRWAAAATRDGGGERPADNALTVTTRIVNPSQVQIIVTNNTASTLWLVDGAGNPCLILRTGFHVVPGEPVSLSSGASEEAARNPLPIDLGQWVQDPAVAQDILSWVTSQTSRVQATIQQVRVKPDMARQLGDVVRLTDGHTGLRAKALITGISLSGDASSYTQTLDLALLAVVFADFDRWAVENNVATFADLDALFVARDLTTFAQFDEWLNDFGGTL